MSDTLNGPRAEHRRLEAFVGSWITEGQTVPTPDGPSLRIRCRDVYEWLPGGFFVVHRWDGRVGETDVHGIEILGYDPVADVYRARFFDSDGNSGAERLTVRDRIWTWTGIGAMGKNAHRCIAVVSDDGDTMTAHHERSPDGTRWQPWMDVILRRSGRVSH